MSPLPFRRPRRKPLSDRIQRIEGHCRFAFRLSCIVVWTVSLMGLRVGLRPLRRLSPAFECRMRRDVVKLWAGGALFILRVHVYRYGRVPEGQTYVVANHLSYLDILIFARELGCVFVAMKEMDSWPVIGFIVRHTDNIFVDRKSLKEILRVNQCIEKALEAGHSVMMFPEATTTDGNTLLPFKPSLLQYPAERKFPVHYASILYCRTNACPDPEHSVAWVDDISFNVHAAGLLRIPQIQAIVRFAAVPVTGENRKELALRLESEVRDLLPAPAV